MDLYRVLVNAIDRSPEESSIFNISGYCVAKNVLTAKNKGKKHYMNTTQIPTEDVDVLHIEAEKVEDNTLIIPDQVVKIK